MMCSRSLISRLLPSASLFGLFVVLAATSVAQRPPVAVVAPHRLYIDVADTVLSLPYHSTHLLDTPDPSVTHLVISQHGASRNADQYFERMVNPAREVGVLGHTAIIAPQFLERKDVAEWGLDPDVLYFTGDAWRGGGLSNNTNAHPRAAQLSAFAALDALLLRCAHVFPNLEGMVLAGHSAGGQYMNRYAAASRLEPVLRDSFGIRLRYIVSNPSSYVYFTEKRPVPGEPGVFAEPDDATEDANPAFHLYKYGVDELPLYWQHTGLERAMAQYENRNVIYLLGEDDNDPNHGSLDTRGGAMLQGPTRLQRGLNYFRYMGHLFGDGVYRHHRIAIVPGVGHSSGGVFASDAGKFYLFGAGERADGPLERYGVSNAK